ncbi:type 4a pilus biogenesis protein PilO [Halomonas sp. CUBES01]|uniref:Type 4a pilus biogenesis protein PilO n=1 Tax=Vreelandella gomseomensis TaxID=370766 RepID=A0ABU1GFU1_9GAMM|nr:MULTISPECIES: type 4a pilus biogenesis protein PilO [Halomonas]MDR5876352.1 type 4a pilus biogenesis protein PilO [Halomonas gomseomensis]MEC4766393.1 type 4a pilus biogenesis protein PilO [Halomonas sp. CUBES01]
MMWSRARWTHEWQQLRSVDLRDLDVKEAGGWPLLLKWLCGVLALLVALLLMEWWVIGERRAALDSAQQQESRLLSDYRRQAGEAAQLPKIREQIATLQDQMTRLRAILPTDAEIPSLLDSISDAAVDNRLTIETVRLRPTVSRTHYVEQPLDIQVRGDFHQIARFAADIASLSRLVTQHDFTLAPADSSGDTLRLSLLARTYREREDTP